MVAQESPHALVLIPVTMAAALSGDLIAHHVGRGAGPVTRLLRARRAGDKLLTWAERLAIAGGIGTLLGGRSRVVAAASGAALLTASALTRFGVLNAGLESVKDPRRVIEPQKARLAARRAAGITDDSITTAG